jgi:tetratricopeptide (TPR) repeat protein
MAKPVSQEFLSGLGRMIEQGMALHRQGHLAEAEKIYTRVLKALPREFATLQLLAQLKMQRGKLGEAFRLMSAAVAVNPNSAEAHVHLGVVLRALQRGADALASFDRALALDPNNVEALGNRGDTLLGQRRPAEALACFDKILALAPNHANARANRGAALAKLDRLEEALADLNAALALAPNDPAALYNRAGVLSGLGRYLESIADYDRVLAIDARHAAAWNNRGNALMALKRHPEALSSFAQAIAIQPDYADAHFNQSHALLATGDFPRGLVEYEWRWKRTGMEQARRHYGQPLWLGEYPLQHKTILVHAEQGLGDTIQFVRYVPLLARMGAKVVLEAPPELTALLSRLAGLSGVVARGDPLPPFDVHCPLGSLPLAFKTELASIPAEIPYLNAADDRIAKWRPRIETFDRPRIALVWSGNPAHANDRNRSIALAKLAPIWATGGRRILSLQRDTRPEDSEFMRNTPEIAELGSDLADFADTAAVIALCDVVISVDTAVAHLAAAMGRPVWIMLPFSPDWRWTLDGTASPWYPAARLFRQPQLGDWESVIDQVARELAAFRGP